MSFIIIVVGTLGISRGIVRRSGLLVRLHPVLCQNSALLK